MKLKTGKAEIVYLLTQVFKKYESTTGQEVVRNTNRKNYEDLAKMLSQISNELPHTAETLGHEHYPPERNPKKLEYPYLKYDITGGQIKDAYNGIVSNPRSFLVDACYIYLYGLGRKKFEQNPVDEELLADEDTGTVPVKPATQIVKRVKKKRSIPVFAFILVIMLSIFCLAGWYQSNKKFQAITADMKIIPYRPNAAEIKAVSGLWLVYIGSPQARVSDANRYHLVANNLVCVKYNPNGYFTFDRYGASFDHLGYMQFENPNVISIHSYLKNNTDTVESPRLSLMRFDQEQKRMMVISASWNFDVGNKNDILGIREVYMKQGESVNVDEVINTVENSSCRCKIVRWRHEQQSTNFYLRNENLDSLQDTTLRSLLDEHSILLRQPAKGVLLYSSSPTKE